MQYIEQFLPPIMGEGLNTQESVNFSGTTTIATLVSTTVSSTGVVTAKSAATVPATAGAVAAGAPITLFSNGPSIYVTSDTPTFTAVKGSLCINTGGSSVSTRLYVNTDGATTWTNFTSAA